MCLSAFINVTIYKRSIPVLPMITFLALLITLLCVGWRPTEAYLEANAHLNYIETHSANYTDFGARPILSCKKNLTIGMRKGILWLKTRDL